MEVGKLPAELLARLLAQVPAGDPRLVVGPKVGEDAAVIDMGDRYLVAKADPITFATDHLGWYAVHVNANDVAVMGARPLWFMATLLLPEGASEALAEEIFQQVLAACQQLGVQLIGGHSEVTYGLGRPIVVGAMLGEVAKERLVQSTGARPGDRLLLTKGIAIEGTAVLARQLEGPLRQHGVAPQLIQAARGLIFQPGISVVREALLAAEGGYAHAMHDPTEGGLATAVHELAQAAGVGAVVYAERVPVLAATASFCHALGLDPLGLLASGALLLATPPEAAEPLAAELARLGIAVSDIGAIASPDQGVIMIEKGGALRPLPRYDRDEVARALARQAT